MKNILKITILFFVLSSLGSCTNDKDPVVSTNGFTLRQDATVVGPTVFSEANKTELFSKLNWDRSNYGPATEASYEIYISDHDLDPNFQNGIPSDDQIDIDVVDARRATFTVDDFNSLMNQLPSFKCSQMNIDIRVKSKLGVGANAIIQYSNPITVAVTGYSKNKPILAVARATDNLADAPRLAASSYTSFSDYEGYVYLEAGSYKLYQADACGDFGSPVVYGLNAGSIIQNGPDSFVVSTAGHYLIKANLTATNNTVTGLNAMAYTASPFTTFGIFGAAKGIPTAANKPMVYDATSKTWKLTFELFKGRKFRFKAVNGSAGLVILGVPASTTDASKVVEYPITSTSGDIRVPGTDDGTKQNYIITLDTSHPWEYTYSLVETPL